MHTVISVVKSDYKLTDKADFNEVVRSSILQQNAIHRSRHELEPDVTRITRFECRKLDCRIFFAECNDIGE